jgi:hypothetical protein
MSFDRCRKFEFGAVAQALSAADEAISIKTIRRGLRIETSVTIAASRYA